MTPRRASLIGVFLLILLFIAVNLLAATLFRNARLDLTERRIFSIDPGTTRLLQKLEEPVTLKFYFSERLARDYQAVASHGARVRDLLEAFAARAKGQIKLEIVDPEPFSSDEDLAEAYGLQGVELGTGEKLFLGLVATNLIDGAATIPFFSPERQKYLEYDIAQVIYRVSTPALPKLGILTSLPLETGPGGFLAQMQGQAEPYVIYQQLREAFDATMLEADLRIVPAGINVLMIAHPGELKPSALYAIDQFVMRGGRVLLFVDPYAESALAPGMGGQPMPGMTQSSDLKPLLAAWGVAYDPQMMVLDGTRALTVQYGAGPNPEVLPYLPWIRFTREEMNPKDLIVANIESIQVAAAGVLKPAEGAKTDFQPLISTTADSAEDRAMIMAFGGDPQSLLSSFKPDGEKRVIAARVSGPVATAFPDGPPTEEEPPADAEKSEAPADTNDETPLPAHIAEAQAPLNLIVIADSDLLEDRFWVEVQSILGQRVAQPTAGNGFLVINAIEQLMGSEDLIALRSRQEADRPFTAVQAIERRARERYEAEEQRLEAEIAATEERLRALQSRRGEDGRALVPETEGPPVLSGEAQAEVRRFEAELSASRLALREVQRELRADVIALGNWVKFFNIAAVPILIAAGAIGFAILRRRRVREG